MRSQRTHRANFLLDLTSSLLVGFVELAEVWVVFRAVHALGGLDLPAVVLVFGVADLAFSLADLAFGHCDTLPTYLRAGTLDVFHLRPQPVLAQLVASDISLRRLARCLVGAAALGYGLTVADVRWSAVTVLLLAVTFLSGWAIFAALFIWAAGLQFFLVNGAEMTNAFVYGGRYAATQPGRVWPRALKVVFGFVFPVAFAAYLPVLRVVDLPSPHPFPTWAGWCAPVAAVWAWAAALACWHWGMRHYQGGGG
jgi:ABC-2 type transport system permease protein